MAQYERKKGQGAAFLNTKTSEAQPDVRGSFLGLDGVEYDIAMWKKVSQAGKPYYSLSIQLPFKPQGDLPPDAQSKDDFPF